MSDAKSPHYFDLHPETLALSYGYDPKLSEGAVKPPIFLTSTFQFRSAEEGKKFFEVAYGLREKGPDESLGLIYSRLNNPNLQIFEERMAVWDKMEMGASFCSGMAAITTSLLAVLRPGDVVLTTAPVYGGTYYFFNFILPLYGIEVKAVPAGNTAPNEMAEAAEAVGAKRVKILYLETPANPTMTMTDIQKVATLAQKLSAQRGEKVYTFVDNTFLGPVFQTPADSGADLVIHSATKFIGGHSDLIAGVVSGPADLIKVIQGFRTILGTVATPFSGWLLLRSLETLSIRMRRQAKTAKKVAHFLMEHPEVTRVHYPGLLAAGSEQDTIFKKQCSGPGSLISFELKGDQKRAFAVLDRFRIFRLAVSLGGTESLVEHPQSMTHSDVPVEELKTIGVSESMIRMSVGIEHEDDLLADIQQALSDLP